MKIWFDFSKLLQFNSRLPVLLQIQRKYVVVRFWFMLQKIFEHNNRNYLRDYYYFRIRDMSRRSLVLKPQTFISYHFYVTVVFDLVL